MAKKGNSRIKKHAAVSETFKMVKSSDSPKKNIGHSEGH
jgi:hypothetical protein